ncbi:MAG: hypothetical protein K2N09_09000 [Muribaculaceae bacterium]|nr:hypothetical protein [Muribaculaceae bacterium]
MNNQVFQKIADRLNLPSDAIGSDGIKFRGNGPTISETGYWSNESGDELIRWHLSRVRILELTKDLNDTEVWDIRTETGLKNHVSIPTIGCRWYHNLMRWEYLLNEFANGRTLPEFTKLDENTLINSFNSVSSARINCKKTAGCGSCPDNVLKEHIARYGDVILEQIQTFPKKPNIILIGGCSGNIILKKIVKELYSNLQIFANGWIHYSEKERIIVINGYNPNPRYRKDKDVYGELRNNLLQFRFRKGTDFLNFE